MSFRRITLLAALLAVALSAVAQSASSSPRLLKGLYDEPETLYGNPEWTFPLLSQLRTEAIRVNLYWGGKFGVAKRRPFTPSDPDDPSYDWGLYDRLALYASEYRIQVVFSIYGTPAWANRGRGLNRLPSRVADLQLFAAAAARRYSGSFISAEGQGLPRVNYWLAWNEPNNPVFLSPQFRFVRGRPAIQSAVDYAKICNAVYTGVHSARIRTQKVACGVTAPRGNNAARSSRPSVSPIAFIRAMRRAGARRIDAYAHHPYYGGVSEEPTKQPPAARGAAATAVTLGNVDSLIREITRLYGRKPLWITEYGYQTNPPDRIFGVTYGLQARYLAQAYAIARRHPRIDMMLWFLLKDEPRLDGWQSGLMTRSNRRKPAFTAFQRVPR